MSNVFDRTASVKFADQLLDRIPTSRGWNYDDKINPQVVRAYVPRGFKAERGRFDIEWFYTGQYHIHYKEPAKSGKQPIFQYRFDKHPKNGVDDRHFHPPPKALSEAAVDSCIKITQIKLVALAVAKTWIEAIEAGDPNLLNDVKNPP